MPDLDISTLEVGGSGFNPPDVGKHHFSIEEAEWVKSSKDKDMLQVSWVVDDDEDPDVGKVMTDYVVLTIHDNKKDKEVLHWNIPRYFALAGVWPTKVSERAKLFNKANAKKTYDRVAKELVGKSGYLTIKEQKGALRPRLDEDGNEQFDENGELITYPRGVNIDKYEFDAVKRKAATETTF